MTAETMLSETHTTGRDKKIPVVEIFGPTIEGEGSLIGTQTYFIRFGLCDYKCKKCDSLHAVDPKLVKAGAQYLTQEQIRNQLVAHANTNGEHIKNVTFSGGNPCIHDLTQLVHMLHDDGFQVFVETQGTKCPDWLWNVEHVVCSPKAPGMGEKFELPVFKDFVHKVLSNGTRLSVKIVVFDEGDIKFAAAIADWLEHNTIGFLGFSPVRDFYLSLGNPYPPTFRITQFMDTPIVARVETEDKIDLLTDQEKKEIPNKNALVVSLLKRYNNLSAEVMKEPRLAFARFLPQLHVLVWGNETGK